MIFKSVVNFIIFLNITIYTTALVYAAANGKIEIVQLLLTQKDIDINGTDI